MKGNCCLPNLHNYYDFKNILIVIMFCVLVSIWSENLHIVLPLPYLEGCNFYSIGLFAQSRQIGGELGLKGSSEGGNYVKSNPCDCIYYHFRIDKKSYRC